MAGGGGGGEQLGGQWGGRKFEQRNRLLKLSSTYCFRMKLMMKGGTTRRPPPSPSSLLRTAEVITFKEELYYRDSYRKFDEARIEKIDFFLKKLTKHTRPPLKNKNSSDLCHFKFFFEKIKKKYFF